MYKMKYTFLNSFATLIGLLVLMGCEDVATNVKMPPAEKKIVVQCFISADDEIIKAMVTWSKPVLGTTVNAEPEVIMDAKVVIDGGGKKETMKWDAVLKLYQLDSSFFNIEAGKAYTLSVTLPNGKNVSASCAVPASKNTSLSLTRRDTVPKDFGSLEITCTFNYMDHDGLHTNYYRLAGQAIYSNPGDGPSVNGDFKKDTELISSNTYKVMYSENSFNKPEKVKAWIINCDLNYFEYHKTLQGAQYNMGLFSEPSIVYSNVNGGLGCFGAYSSFEIEVDL